MSRLCLLLTCCLVKMATAADSFPTFQEQVLDPEIGKVCYAVTLADVDGDALTDIVAVTENRVLWYRNPGPKLADSAANWKSHVIIENQTPLDNVCIAVQDIDGDGRVDFALGAGWTKIGTLHWLQRPEQLDRPWKVHTIGEERWTHRMRWADVLGTGTPQLVVSPLNATVGDGVRLTAFEIPERNVTGPWKRTVLDASLNRMHNHWHVDLDRDGTVDTLTASQEGVHLIRRTESGWMKTKLGHGETAESPNQSGAGEIKTGKLGGGETFITTVEPMHGHTLAIYTKPQSPSALWNRHILDTGFQRGHAIWTADVDLDGDDEIVFGHSDTPQTFGVIVYDCVDHKAQTWSKHVVDSGGMACEDLIVEDLTGDGRPDIVAGGRATHNLKLYVNTAP